MKRYISIMLAVCICITCCGKSVFAMENRPQAPTGSGDITPVESIEEQLAALSGTAARSATAEDELIRQKLLNYGDYAIVETSSSTSWVSLPGTYICYAQEDYYYCMAATAKAVLQYLNGSSKSQDAYAIDLCLDSFTGGGDFTLMKPYLNSKQSVNKYVSKNYQTSLYNMQGTLLLGVSTSLAPPVLRIDTKNCDGWLYETDGHVLAVNAVRADKNYIQMTDPWILYAGIQSSSFYKLSAEVVHEAVTATQYCGYIY